MTMVITSILFMAFLREKWRTGRGLRHSSCSSRFLIVDVAFLAANVPKIPHGGWFPLLVGFGLVIQMTTWRKGRQLVAARIRRGERPMGEVVEEAFASNVVRVDGVAVYMFKDEGAAPPALLSNLRHNHVLHDKVLLVSVHTADVPNCADHRAVVTDLGNGVHGGPSELRVHGRP